MKGVEVEEILLTRPASERRSVVVSSDRTGTRVSSISIVLPCFDEAEYNPRIVRHAFREPIALRSNLVVASST